jgi:hypothetical protein
MTADPEPIQDVIRNPGKHARNLSLPSVERKLRNRIEEIRTRAKKDGEGNPTESEDIPVVPETDQFDLGRAGLSANGSHARA